MARKTKKASSGRSDKIQPAMIICKPNSLRVEADASVLMTKRFVRVVTNHKVFEVNLKTATVSEFARAA
jgi:hypothetical protein